jgi:YidC/Oxa1 family membrane protein insertase
MDKKSILGIVLAAGGLIAWQIHQAKEMREYQIAKAKWDADHPAEQAKPAASNAPVEAAPATTPNAAPTPAVAASLEKRSTKAAEYVFTNLGGGISRITLQDHLTDKKTGEKVVLNEFGAIPIGAISEAAGEKTATPYTVQSDTTAGTVTYERVDDKQLALTKKFTLPSFEGEKNAERLRDEYLLKLDLTFTNRGKEAQTVAPYWLHLGSAAPLHEKDSPLYIGFNYLRNEGSFGIGKNHLTNLNWFSAGGFAMWSHPAKAVFPETPQVFKDTIWGSVSNQYFCTLATPQVDEKATDEVKSEQRAMGVWARRNTLTPEQWTQAGRPPQTVAELHNIDGALQMGGFKLEPGQTVTRSFQILAGPSEYRRLRQFEESQTEILDFGMFGWISKGLLNSLNGLKSILGHYWAAIMVLTIIIRSCMWPLQNRATQTAKKMQALSPRLKEIQERYKDDPMRMQQETGKLWKQYGINPLGGCLPMFVQIPIFFGFYNMLNKAVELRNQEFLWVQDLSQSDTIAHLFGMPINILPLVMAGTMLVQMQLTPKAGDPVQQRMMMFMPLIFIGLCYNYASALALYWSVQNIFSIVQLYLTRDKTSPVVEVIPPPTKTKRKT